MADLQRLIDDLSSAEFQRGIEQEFWELVDRQEWKVYVRLVAADGRVYVVELDCAGYRDEPIHGRFVDPATRQCVASAWPQGSGAFTGWVKFTGELFICWDQDREGIQRHPDWRQRRMWTQKPNQVVAYLDFLRQLLHVESFGYQRQCAQPN
jgi:hypothetical protein